MTTFRVEVAYRYRRRKLRGKRLGVLLGMTVDAENENQAATVAHALAIKGRRSRVWLRTSVKREVARPAIRRGA